MLQNACTYVYTTEKPEFVAERTTDILMQHALWESTNRKPWTHALWESANLSGFDRQRRHHLAEVKTESEVTMTPPGRGGDSKHKSPFDRAVRATSHARRQKHANVSDILAAGQV